MADWNPITGCSEVSPGCTHCYAMRLAGSRLRDHPSRAGLTRPTRAGPVWTGVVRLNEGWLGQPLRWRAPRTIFVCAHGDLFHQSIPDEWIDRVFAVMALSPQHTFQVLTKRSGRMRAYLGPFKDGLGWPEYGVKERAASEAGRMMEDGDNAHDEVLNGPWPLPHVWLGVSVEDQRRADERIPDLLSTPAELRFVSTEPLIGPVDLTRINLGIKQTRGYGPKRIEWDALTGWEHQFPDDTEPGCDPLKARAHGIGECGAAAKLDWVIVGGESGPGARPMHIDHARSLVGQCSAAGIACFVKQLGRSCIFRDSHGGDMTEWPADLRVREMPAC